VLLIAQAWQRAAAASLLMHSLINQLDLNQSLAATDLLGRY
jgi:hypothetical protein